MFLYFVDYIFATHSWPGLLSAQNGWGRTGYKVLAISSLLLGIPLTFYLDGLSFQKEFKSITVV
jgi:hypothetical protein